MRIYVLCALAVCLTLLVAPASSGRTMAGGPEWLPLKGTFANGIGCTWNNGCQSPTPGYHGYPAVDFMVRSGTEVFAAGPGVVMVAYRGCPDASSCGPNGSGLGNSVAIRHENGVFSWYGHLSDVVVEEGWSVAAGDPIGRTGSSGRSMGPHLHYEERSALWVGAVSPGPMLAYHGSRLVSYPGVLKRGAWDAVPCGRQAGEPGCRTSSPLRNDGYTVQEATAPKPKPGECKPQRMGVVFVLDDSGSNADTDPRFLRADAARVALDILPEGTLVSAVNFHNSAYTVLDTTRLTSANRQQIAQQIRASLRTGGGTNYELGFRQALVQLGRMRGVQRIVIFLSDGKPTSGYASDRNIGAQVIPIHTVGYGPVRNLPVLIDIAKRSHPSATYQPIENVAEASNAFATIVHPYQCNKAIGGDNLTLRPNKEYKRSFTVPRNAPGISALATWTHQDAPAVWLRRPDGTTIRPGAGLRVGERVARPGQQVIRFDVSRPTAGRWTLIAQSRNWVSLAFDVWRTQAPPVAVAPGTFKYVALGDSYSSGEGVDPYFRDGTDRKTGKTGVVDNRCHRSTRAYATWVQPGSFDKPLYAVASGGGDPGGGRGQNKYRSDSNVRSSGGVEWAFWACSGAVAVNVLPKKAGGISQQEENENRDPKPQLDMADLKGADLVTLTIGGNDIGFSDVLEYCAKHSCDTGAYQDERLKAIERVRPLLKRTYLAIRERAPNARILVLGYPQLFPASEAEQSCRGLSLFLGEQNMLRGLGRRLNETIQGAVADANKDRGRIEFVSALEAFSGHEVCGSDGSWLNGVDLSAHPGRMFRDDESFHPTLEGQRAYGKLVDAVLRQKAP